MRRRVRIQPYIASETQRKLRAYAGAQALTESAVAEAAIVAFVDGSREDESLIVRRLDALTGAVAQLQHDANTSSNALAYLVKLALQRLLAGSQPENRQASDQVDAVYDGFLAFIAGRLQAGTNIGTEVRRAVAKRTATWTPPPGQKGR